MGLGNNAEDWLNQAKEQFEAGDFEGAITSYDKAIVQVRGLPESNQNLIAQNILVS